MSYDFPNSDTSTSDYLATFQHVNGTQIQVRFYDPAVMGPLDTTDDDFQSAVDALASANGWQFLNGRKAYATTERINPT